MVDPSSPNSSNSNTDYNDSTGNEDVEAFGHQTSVDALNSNDVNLDVGNLSGTSGLQERMRSTRTTISDIIESLNSPNASVTIPEQPTHPSVEDEDIDHARIEQFYTSSLGAINRMRREMQKSQGKTAELRVQVGDQRMDDWTNEHCQLVDTNNL